MHLSTSHYPLQAYIIAQVERFCTLYNIRGLPETEDPIFGPDLSTTHDANSLATAAAAGISVSPSGGIVGLPSYMDHATTAAVNMNDPSRLNKKQVPDVTKANRMAKDAEKALVQERKSQMKQEQKRLTQERKEQKQREREAQALQKAQERAQREESREERRKKKLEIRQQREKFAQEQKELALKRAAELVASNRVPIEITRGAAAAKAAASAALAVGGHSTPPQQQLDMPPSKKPRSAIVVSTAADLHQIVTHSKNLWAKYNAIAKEHNQKVNWITVAKELGIHVKVREKYARMHSRAEQRGFDWEKNGHWKIKDHPEIFIEPTESEQKAKMPLSVHDATTTVLVDGNKKISTHDNHQHNPTNDNQHNTTIENHNIHNAEEAESEGSKVTDEAVAAAARVVDASGVNSQHVDNVISPNQEHAAAAAAVAASFQESGANLMNEEAFQEMKAPVESM